MDNMLSSVDEKGMSRLNAAIALMLGLDSNQEGEIILAQEIISQSMDIDLNGIKANIELEVSDVSVSNIDSLGALKLLQPIMGESSVLDNEASLGVGEDPISLSLRLKVKGKCDKVDFNNEVELSLSLQNLIFIVQLLAEMEEPSFLFFPLEDIKNFNCWLSSIMTPALDAYGIRIGENDSGVVLRKLAIEVERANLDMKCIYCSSPMIQSMEHMFQTQAGIEETTATVNRLFDYGTTLLGGEYMQTTVDRMLKEAGYQCPHSPMYEQQFAGLKYEELPPIEANEESSIEFLIAILVVVAAIAMISASMFVITTFVKRRHHRCWMETLNDSQVEDLKRLEQDDKKRQRDLNKRMNPLIFSQEVPCLVRYFMPIIIIGNIGLFLSGHFSLGATVNISAGNIGEEGFKVENFFTFSMV